MNNFVQKTKEKTVNKAKVVKVELCRGEGPSADCNKWHTLNSWDAADDLLRKWSETAPKCAGYDKCDFKLIFDDGDEYEGKYDLKHWSCEQDGSVGISLAKHVKEFLRFVSGVRPAWMCDAHWKQTRLIYGSDEKEARAWLDAKEIPA